MELTIKLDSSEVKSAIIAEAKDKFGIDFAPADLNLFIKFDDATKSVTSATLTVKKD